MFRELAVSYLSRNDLAHVQPEDLAARGMESKPAPSPISSGMVRGQTAGLRIVSSNEPAIGGPPVSAAGSVRASAAGSAPRATAATSPVVARSGSLAVTASAAAEPTTSFRRDANTAPATRALFEGAGPRQTADQRDERPLAASKAAETNRRMAAMMKGYTGDSCPECSNFTMVRNGTCLKCDTCGSTSGCS